MAQLRRLLRREILAVDSGREIGRPSDFLVDPKKHEVALVVLSYGSIPETAVVAPATAVESFDTDALALDSIESLQLAVHDKHLLEQLEQGIQLRHRLVFSHEGSRIGTIVAIDVDAKGHVVEYRLRRPRFGLFRPRFSLKPAQIDRLGADVVVTKAKIRLP